MMSRFRSPAFRAVKVAKRIFSICVRRTSGTGTGVSTDVDAALLVLARLVGGVWCLLAIEAMLEEEEEEEETDSSSPAGGA
jgi:hypothetical protein